MRKLLSILLAVVLVASVAVMAVGAADVDDAAQAAGTATVTLYDIKGNTVTKTYSVGETFTACVYLNTSSVSTAGIGSLKGQQTYDSSILELADAYDDADGMISNLSAMFPQCGSGAVANGKRVGGIYYNASTPGYNGFKFNSDDSALIISHYTVKAAGTTSIENSMTTLAVSDYDLTRIIDRGAIKVDTFTTKPELSEPAAPAGSTVSGTVTSYSDSINVDPKVTVQILSGETVVGSYEGTGNSLAYSIDGIADGDYTLRVSKKNHVTRDYDITVSGDTTADAEIWLRGDVNGDGEANSRDTAAINRHVQEIEGKELTGYPYLCADANNDGNVNSRDTGVVNRHAQEITFMW